MNGVEVSPRFGPGGEGGGRGRGGSGRRWQSEAGDRPQRLASTLLFTSQCESLALLRFCTHNITLTATEREREREREGERERERDPGPWRWGNRSG